MDFENKLSKHYASYSRGRYNVKSGITVQELKEILSDKHLGTIQFDTNLKKKDFENLELIIFSKKPAVTLRSYGSFSGECLNFLFLAPSVKKLCIHYAVGFKNMEAILALKNLEELDLDQCEVELFEVLKKIKPTLKKLHIGTASKKLDVSFLSRFTKLTELYLTGHTKGIEEIGKLKNLQKLLLRSVTLTNIDFLKGLDKLWSVEFKLGGIKDFSVLKQMQQIKSLELWMVRDLSDLSFISSMTGLQNIHLESLIQVKELPVLSKLKKLRKIWIANMKGLKNISALQAAPALEGLSYTSIINHQPKDLIFLFKNKAIKEIYVYFPSEKNNMLFKELAKPYVKTASSHAKFKYV